jgi:hypothetical protein
VISARLGELRHQRAREGAGVGRVYVSLDNQH